MATITVEERVSRLEGGYEHLATKGDIADVRAEIADVRAEIAGTIKWTAGLVVAASLTIISVMAFLLERLPG